MRILITGGSGTLGHAIVRYLPSHDYTIFSRSESRLAAMKHRYPRGRYIVGDVRDYAAVEAAIAGHDVVIHAAALKRIPECENQPTECIATNIGGTANVLRACAWSNVPKVIGISTDKACRAITAYGASKLMMEKQFQANAGSSVCCCVRYGNVLSSTGSVLPIWQKQWLEHRPLTITSAKMSRFILSAAHAVQIIERALVLGNHADIIVPKLKSIRITDLAEYLYPGYPTDDIGTRSTEKNQEDLVSDDETVVNEDVNYYVLGPGGKQGVIYRSDMCDTITEREFAQILRETGDIEEWLSR